MRSVFIPRVFEMMSVVHGNSIEKLAARKNRVPHFFKSGFAASAEIVDQRMPVVDFKELVVFDLFQVVRRNRPAEIRMIYVRNAPRVADFIDISLDNLDHAVAALRFDQTLDIEPIDMDGFIAEFVGNFLAANDYKLFFGAVNRIETINIGDKIMIGQYEKIVAVLAIPAHNLIRRRIAVAVNSMCMSVA